MARKLTSEYSMSTLCSWSFHKEVSEYLDELHSSCRLATTDWMHLLQDYVMGYSPAHEVVVKFLHYGANGHMIDRFGRTLLMRYLMRISTEHNVQPDIIRTLLAHGGSINMRDSTGTSALNHYLARGTVKAEIVKMLIRYGADPHAQNDTLHNPLAGFFSYGPFNSTEQDTMVVLKTLSDVGVDFRSVTACGETLLHIYTARFPVEYAIICVLLGEGCDPGLHDQDNNTAVDNVLSVMRVRKSADNLRVVDTLADAGAVALHRHTTKRRFGPNLSDDILALCLEKSAQPYNLQNLARRKIRSSVRGGFYHSKVTQLGLPTSLRDFCLFQ